MKKLKILLIIGMGCLLSANNVYSQKSYLTLNGGYNFSAAGDLIGYDIKSNKVKAEYGTLGKGISVGVNYGNMFSDHIGGEIGISYLMGSEYEFVDTDISGTDKTTVSGKTMRVYTGLRFTAGERIKPYAKFGLIIGVGNEVTANSESSSGTSKYLYEYVYKEGLSLGLSGALGIDMPVSERLMLFAEANLISQSWRPAKLEITETITTPLGTFTDTESVTLNNEVSLNSNDDLKPSMPFSSIGINLGIKFLFGS